MIPAKGGYTFLAIAVIRSIFLVLFLNTQESVYIILYAAMVIPIIYLILALCFPKLDKFNLFKRKKIDFDESH